MLVPLAGRRLHSHAPGRRAAVEPAPHAAGELANILAADIRQGDLLQQFAYPPPALPLRQPFQGGHMGQIVLHGKLLVKAELLGQEAENVTIPLPQRLDGNTVVHHLAGGGLHDPGDYPHQGGLARAVSVQKAPDARRQPKADVADCGFVLGSLGNAVDQ